MTDRTRYKWNTVNYSNSGGRTGTLRRYCRYKSGLNWAVSDNTNTVNGTITQVPNVVMLTDQIYTVAEKAAIKKTGRRELKSKKALSWKSAFDSYYKVIRNDGSIEKLRNTQLPLLRINNSIKSSSVSDDFLEFKGLPYPALNYFGFNKYTLLPKYTLKDKGYTVPSSLILSSYQKMCKDANMLNLHDQNIFTTIGELKDFKQTVRTVTKHVFSDKKYIADKYLGVNFGIIPFYSDMKNYVENYNNFAPNLKKWNDLGIRGKVLNKHRLVFKEKFEDSFVLDSGNSAWPSSSGTYKYRAKYNVAHDVKILTNMYFRAKPLHGDDENALIRSINGLSKPFTAVWNLIPFSFLVDWFVNVGDTIEQMEYQKPVVKFDILDCCYSVRFHQQVSCDLYLVDNNTGEETYLGSSELDQSFYNRIPITGKYVADVINSVGVIGPLQLKTELSGYQWSLAAALAVTNLKLKR